MTHEKKLARVRRRKERFEQEREIREIRQSMRRFPTTTKLILAFILINCTVVEIYAMWVMWYLMDLSALYALISAVVTESLSFAVYSAKAYHETKQEEIIKLEREKLEFDTTPPANEVEIPEG